MLQKRKGLHYRPCPSHGPEGVDVGRQREDAVSIETEGKRTSLAEKIETRERKRKRDVIKQGNS